MKNRTTKVYNDRYINYSTDSNEMHILTCSSDYIWNLKHVYIIMLKRYEK